jgi:superfamily II DNA or RNA helicase
MTQLDEDGVGTSPRFTRKFMWETVDESLIRQMLAAVYEDNGQSADAEKSRDLESGILVSQAGRALGRPLNRKHLTVQLGLTGEDRNVKLKSKRDLLEFFDRRRMTETLRLNLHTAFVSAHKDLVEVTGPASGSGGRDTSSIVLSGAGATDRRKAFDHQVAAWRRLNEMARSRKASERSGLLVLPTGAGKTYTMVAWLLRQLDLDPSLRVLWIADQQELVDQASRAFRDHAQMMPSGASRIMRVIHGSGSLVSSLADDGLDVVCTTRQSLIGAGFAEPAQRRLEAFLSRPCIVVVDEAHHAVAPTYRNVLDFVLATAPHTLMVGLTATPWPRGAHMTAMLRERFPVAVADVETRDLVKAGVLAKPQMHTVDTNEIVVLSPDEVRQIAGRDLPPSVLRDLDRQGRNELIVDTWINRREEWGKTLVFACDIRHSERLGHAFDVAGVANTVIHSRSEADRGLVLEEFRKARGEAVLISVGMLLEGVDIPDARTAFLTRPTASRIVLRQMIGRVLRGVAGGGEEIANIVDLRDRWSADVDVLAPVDIVDLPMEVHGGDGPPHRLPPVLDEISGDPVPEDILKRIERAYAEARAGLPYASALVSTRLVGFYELGYLNVPVFEHAQSRWEDVVGSEVAEEPYVRPMEMFDDLPVPQPVPSDIKAVVEFCRSEGVAPPLVKALTTLSVVAIAREIRAAGALSEDQRMARLRELYESTIARSAFPSFQTFFDAVQQELLAMSGMIGVVSNPEGVEHSNVFNSAGPALGRRPSRELEPLFRSAIARGRALLAEAAPELEDLLQNAYLPPAEWTRFPVKGAWAYWHPRLHGRARGKPVIRVNCALQGPTTQISDELLEYLLWHELIHHVLPGRGHDAEFRRLESLWPDFAKLDHELDSIEDRFDFERAFAKD